MSKTIIEEIRISGDKLISKVKQILKEGNIRRIIIKNDDGDVLLDVPLTIGVAGFGTSLLAMGPLITALGAFALFYNDYNIVVEREPNEENEVEAEIINIEDEDEDEDEEEDESDNSSGKKKKVNKDEDDEDEDEDNDG